MERLRLLLLLLQGKGLVVRLVADLLVLRVVADVAAAGVVGAGVDHGHGSSHGAAGVPPLRDAGGNRGAEGHALGHDVVGGGHVLH